MEEQNRPNEAQNASEETVLMPDAQSAESTPVANEAAPLNDESTHIMPNATAGAESAMPSLAAAEAALTAAEAAPAENQEYNPYAELAADEFGEPIFTSDWLKRNTRVHGWLVFFLFAITLGGVISAAFPIFTFNLDEYGGSYFLAACDIVQGLFLCTLALYTVYAFDRRKPNAVFCARCYIILVFAVNAISLIGGNVDDTAVLGSTKQLIRSLVWSVIWFLYLLYSEQVEEIIPKSFRKVTWRDWTFVGAPFILWIACFCTGVFQLMGDVNRYEEEKAQMMQRPLQDNERTDGVIIFTVPEDFDCDSQDVTEDGETITIFTLTDSLDVEYNMFAGYDKQSSDSYFEELWQAGEDAELKRFRASIESTEKLSINGNTCHHRVARYFYLGNTVYWDFYLMFSPETEKYVSVQVFDTADSHPAAKKILNSIRFK